MSGSGLRPTPGCVCGEINTRHCPVHGQGATPREPGDSLSLSRGEQDVLPSLHSSRIALAWRAATEGYWRIAWTWLAHGRPF